MQPDLLRQLKDVHLPQAPGIWPPAPGWWVMLGMGIATSVVAWLWVRRRRVRQRPYRVARAELVRLGASFDAGTLGVHDLAHGASALLKRALIVHSGRTSVAQLTGDEWLRHLDRVNGDAAFTGGAGTLLGAGRFDPAGKGDAAHLIALVDDLLSRLERGR